MYPKLGVIIVTYNRLKLLKECIKACAEQSYPFSEILVVDNHSTDGTVEYLKKMKEKHISVIELGENMGGAGGFCAGVNYFCSKKLDFILFIDDDAILDLDYNKIIVEHMSAGDGVVGYSGTVMTAGDIMLDHRRYLKHNFKETFSSAEDYEKEFFDYDLSSFCGLFLPLDIIKKIGLPRKDFFIWFDDTEYCIRVHKYGRIRNINAAFLDHKTTQTAKSGYCWKSFYAIRNKYAIIKDHYGPLLRYIYIAKCYCMIMGGYIMAAFKRDNYYRLVGEMYKDALRDARKSRMGRSPKYTNDFKIEKEIK